MIVYSTFLMYVFLPVAIFVTHAVSMLTCTPMPNADAHSSFNLEYSFIYYYFKFIYICGSIFIWLRA